MRTIPLAMAVLSSIAVSACQGGDDDGKAFHECVVEYSPDWEEWKDVIGYRHDEPELCPVYIKTAGEVRYHAGMINETSKYWESSFLEIYNAVGDSLASDVTDFVELQDGTWSAYISESYAAGTAYGDDEAYHQLTEAWVNAYPSANVLLPWRWDECTDCV